MSTTGDLRLLSKEEAAAKLNISERTIERAVLSGNLPIVRFNHRVVRFRECDVLNLVRVRKERGRK